MRVAVLVLGDVGLSPRMQYHTGSLAKEGFDVDLVGFTGEYFGIPYFHARTPEETLNLILVSNTELPVNFS